MKRVLILAALAGSAIPFLAPATPAQAQTRQMYPFCYVQNDGFGQSGGYQCYYRSFAECMATQSGRGGSCYQNPELVAQQQARQQQALSKPRRVVR